MKKIFFAALIIANITVLSSCEKDGKNSGMPRESMPENATVTEYIMQEGDTQIVGEVTQIVGNEITLALGNLIENNTEKDMQKIPQFDTENGDAPQMPQDGDMPKFDMENGEAPQMPEGGFPDMGDGDFPDMPEGGFPNMDGGNFPDMNSDEASGSKRGGRKSSVSVEKSGETGTYIIPVGMTVIGASGRNSDYSAISAGMTLRLTLNSDGYTVSAEIL